MADSPHVVMPDGQDQHRPVPHPNGNYDATDSRERTEGGWASIDQNSGPASETDWSCSGHFPDGPGPWRQT